MAEQNMYIGWHCFSFTSTTKHENSDYNIANFDVIKLPVSEVCFYTPRSGKWERLHVTQTLTWIASVAIRFQWLIIKRVRCQNYKYGRGQDTYQSRRFGVATRHLLGQIIWMRAAWKGSHHTSNDGDGTLVSGCPFPLLLPFRAACCSSFSKYQALLSASTAISQVKMHPK